jgi:hypothetical protein
MALDLRKGADERSIEKECKFSMDELTEQYLSMLKESSGCITLYASHIHDLESKIQDLRAELKEKEQKLLHFMTKDSFSISRHDFRSFFVTVKNRKETDAEWDAFETTFRFRLQVEIYKWIDSLGQ